MIQKQKIRVVVLILALLTGLLLLLPTFLSIAPLNKIVFNTLNRQVAPAKLSIEKIDLGWLSKQKADGIRYQNEEAGIQANIKSALVEKNLLLLLFSRTDPGTIRLESPRIMIPLKTTSDFKSKESDDETESDKGELDKEMAKSLGQIVSAWGSASINDGQVSGVTKEGDEILLLDQVQLETAVQNETSKVAAKLSAKSGCYDGSLLGDVVINIPEDGVFNKSSFVGQGKLILTDWNLDELLPLVALFSDRAPFGRGWINGEWRMENPFDEQLQLLGTLKGKNITLYGGFLEKDQPKISNLDCAIDALRQKGQWSVRQFNFTTPLGTGIASGYQEKSSGNRQLNLDTRINIAPALAQFPNTLKIRNDLKITNGVIKVSGNITHADDSTFFKGLLRLTRLEGQQGKRKFVWKKPLTITGQGSYHADQWVVDQAKISSPFLNGDGHLTPNRVKGHLSMDAAKTFKQVGQFFKLPSIALEGPLETQFTANRKGAGWDLNVKASSDALGVLSRKKVLVGTAPFSLHLTSQYKVENGKYLLTTPQLEIQSGLGGGLFQSDQMTLQPDGKILKIVNATTSGNMDIGKLEAIYSAVTATQPKRTYSGTTRYEVAFNAENEQVRFQNITLTATPLTLFDGQRRFSDQKISLKGTGIVDVKNRSASFTPVTISATAGKLTVESFKLSDWHKPFEGMTANATANFELSRFASIYGGGKKWPQASLAGHGEAMLKFAFQKGELAKLEIKGIVTPFKWHFQNQVKINEPKMIVDLEVGPTEKAALAIKRLLVKSNLISLSGTGSFVPAVNQSLLQISGSVEASLNKLSLIFSGLLDRPVVFSGKKEAPFSMEIARDGSRQDSRLKSLRINVLLPANRVTTMGILLDQLKLPVAIEENRAIIDIKAAVNGGKITLSPVVDLDQDPSIAVGQGAVLTNVRITQSMTDELLARLHPIFVGATSGQGTVDLYLEKLDWPMAGDNMNQPICEGYLNFNKVALTSAGMLEGLLILLKAKRSNLSITSGKMGFFCQEEQMTTAPLTLKTDDTVIILEGSMGFDQTLDYVAKIPITKKMVSVAMYSYLADSMIAIPIGGTADKPQIDTHQFYVTLANLAKEAGGEVLRKETDEFIKDKADGLLKQIFK